MKSRIVFALLIAAAWVLLVSYIVPARAHEWFGSTQDPVYQSSCCGGHDCAPVDAEWVTEAKDGYWLKMTIIQSQTVNPSSQSAVDAFVPSARVQSPPTAKHQFYACIYDRDRAPPRKGVICFFATPSM